MVTKERMNEILDLVVGEQELTPELMECYRDWETGIKIGRAHV